MMHRLAALLSVATAVLLALGACSLWGTEGGPGGIGAADPTASAGPTPVAAVTGADGVQRVDISMGDDLRLHPALVRARPGAVEFTFHNTGAVPHDIEFQLPAGQTNCGLRGGECVGRPGTGNLGAGASTTVRVQVDSPGTYPFPCLYHQSSGMTGTLVVATG